MVKKKTKSKRVPLKLKYGIQKRVKAHNKKMKKLAKKHPELARRQPKKDPGIPNLWPHKEALMEQMERRQEKMQDEKERQREARRREIERRRKVATIAGVSSGLVQAPSAGFGNGNGNGNGNERELRANNKDASRKKWYMGDLKKTLEESDVILEVLDARDPMSCRCVEIEDYVLGELSAKSVRPKRLVLVLNKVDLVPPAIALQWVEYLKKEFPTMVFKASTQRQASRISRQGRANETAEEVLQNAHRSAASGAGRLMNVLKQYALHNGVSTAITVGVIGFPNVGKSSIINSLKRSRAVGVGSTPGFTRSIQHVKLDRNVTLVDSPGVLFSALSAPELALRNCVRVEQVEDPVAAIAAILSKCSWELLMSVYSIASFSNADEFLFRVAHKRGRLGPGGVPLMEATARDVIRDWNAGKIPYYSKPPESSAPRKYLQRLDANAVEDAVVGQLKRVDQMAPEFDINALLDDANAALFAEMPESVHEAECMELETELPQASGAPMFNLANMPDDQPAPTPFQTGFDQFATGGGDNGDDDDDDDDDDDEDLDDSAGDDDDEDGMHSSFRTMRQGGGMDVDDEDGDDDDGGDDDFGDDDDEDEDADEQDEQQALAEALVAAGGDLRKAQKMLRKRQEKLQRRERSKSTRDSSMRDVGDDDDDDDDDGAGPKASAKPAAPVDYNAAYSFDEGWSD